MDQFRRNFNSHKFVKIPQPLYPLVTQTVLVETYEVRNNLIIIFLQIIGHTCRILTISTLGRATYFTLLYRRLAVGMRGIFQDGGRFGNFQTLISLLSYFLRPYNWLS